VLRLSFFTKMRDYKSEDTSRMQHNAQGLRKIQIKKSGGIFLD
jgi:hypothetical protein